MAAKKEKNINHFTKNVEDTFELDKTYQSEGELVFRKPKKYEHVNEKITKIIVNDKKGDREITREELSDYISSNKKLNKIIIEEVNVNDLKRTNLIFDQRKIKSNKSEISFDVDCLEIEKTVNRDFFNGALSGTRHVLHNEFSSALDSMKVSKNVSNSIIFEDEEEYHSNTTQNRKIIEKENIKSINTEAITLDNKEVEDISISKLSLSNLTMGNEDSQLDDSDDNEYELKNVQLKRQELKRKNNKSLSKLYYKVKNHIELFKLGDSYLRDFNRGIKSLAFNSYGYKEEREKTVLGVTSFLNYNAKVTVTVVTDNLKESLYHTHITDLEEIKKTIPEHDITYTCYATQGVEFIEFAELCDVMYQLGNFSFEDFIEQFVENSDVILWDLPQLSEMDNKKELYYPVIRSVESVSLIVKSNDSKYSDIYTIKDYFDKYKVPFKGFVLSP